MLGNAKYWCRRKIKHWIIDYIQELCPESRAHLLNNIKFSQLGISKNIRIVKPRTILISSVTKASPMKSL